MNPYTYTLSTAFNYINRYPTYWFWMLLRLAYVGIGVVSSILLGSIIDILSHKPFDNTNLCWFAGSYIALLFIAPGLEVITAAKALYTAGRTSRDFRNDAVRLLENAPIDFFKLKNRGAFLKIIDSAHDSMYRFTDDLSHRYLNAIGSIIGIFLSAIILQPFIVIIFLLSAGLSLFNLYIFGRREHHAGTEWSQQEESVTGGMAEFLNNFKTVFYLNLFRKQEADLQNRIEKGYQARMNLVRCSMRKWYHHGQLQQITTILIFIYCMVNVVNGNFTLGMLVIILAFNDKLSNQMGILLDYAETFTSRVTAFRRFHDELALPLSARHNKTTGLIAKSFHNITIRDLSLMRDERENLSGITLNIRTGQKIALVGHTGCGKSTLLDVLLKAVMDYTGEIRLNEIDYHKITGRDIVNIFSIVPQEVQLFRDTLRGNIASSTAKPSDDELKALLEICQLTEFVAKLPAQADELILEGSTNISGGERQRIGIARALFQNHPFLILDEATASLDPLTEDRVIRNIISCYPSLTLLYVTHKYSLLNNFDTVLLMNEGRIIEQGSFSELKDNSALFQELYNASKTSVL